MGLVSIKHLEQQSKHSTKNTVAIIIITSIIIKHFREDEAWEETGTTHRPAQELWGMNKLVAGRPQNLPAAGSALMVGGAHLCGCGGRRAVQRNSLPPSTLRWRWALEGTIFLAGVHPPLQRCPVLRHHYPGQRAGWEAETGWNEWHFGGTHFCSWLHPPQAPHSLLQERVTLLTEQVT